MKLRKILKRLFGFTRLVKPFAQIWTRAMTWQSSCTRNLRKPSFANAHSYGFTLAEVLITLSILGVVAAITVPSIINKNSEREMITKLKKTYSAFQEAFDVTVAENGPIGGYYSKYGWMPQDKIAEHLNVVKTCKTGDTTCTPVAQYKTFNNNNFAEGNLNKWSSQIHFRTYVLKDGTILNTHFGSYNGCQGINTDINLSDLCGEFKVDLNGKKGPNKIGVDVFAFYVSSSKGAIPMGYGGNTSYYTNYCNKNSSNGLNGMGCAAWALYKGNMDYKRKTVSW